MHVTELSTQLHPAPEIAVALRPVGKLSAIVIALVVGPAPMLATTRVYTALWPCTNDPACVEMTVRSGTWTMAVTSAPLSFDRVVSPPPLTVAAFVTLTGASLATSTVSATGG